MPIPPSYPSVEVALSALQARNEELERLLEEARRGGDLEAALDRVWTRALAVRHSDETLGVAVAVFDALRELGLPVLQITLSGQPEGGEAPVWTAGVDGDGEPRASHYLSALTGHPLLDAARATDETGVERLDRAAFEAYLRAALVRYPASYADRVVGRTPVVEAYHVAVVPAGARQSGPFVAVLSREPTDGEVRVLERFAILFGLAYARHRDLQRAEVQAQASQTDAAVERVRARALAMRRSDDVGDAVAEVFAGLGALGVPAHRSTLAILDPESRDVAYWSSDAPEARGTMRLGDRPFYDALWVAWRRQRDLSYILEGAELAAYRSHLGGLRPGLREAHPSDDREYVHAVSVPSGVLVAYASRPFSEDTVQTMQRMAEAFAFAYDRHLELQASEARARQAAQTASVDRVRAEIASMRTGADLDRVTPLMWEELTGLGVPFVRCGVFIVEEATGAVRALLATPDGEPLGALLLPFGTHPLVDRVVDHWRRRAALDEIWDRAQMTAWADTLATHGLRGSLGAQPDALALHFAPFTQGMLYVGAPAPLSDDDVAAAQALADAFEVAYARYDDFQRLDARTREVEAALADLRAAQQQLVQSEKLASLGQLTAGIAHEIKNPLNFVNNFASLSRELADELAAELENDPDPALVREILGDLISNAARIEEHGRRADSIVRAMMQHARGAEGERVPLALNALVDEHVNLAYHGRRAQTPDFNVTIERAYDATVDRVEAVAQDLGRVLINLVNNAFDAVAARAAAEDAAFEPTLRVSTARTASGVEIRVEDNGTGIPEDVLVRVFEPFYTTKPTGQGTGLGLSMSHDIIEQGHGGALRVESEVGEGTTFVVALPD